MNKNKLYESEYDDICNKVIHGYDLLLDIGSQYFSELLKDSSHILSVGCGTCNEITHLNKYNTTWEYTALDISEEMINISLNKMNEQKIIDKVILVNGDISKIKTIKYDSSILSLVLARVIGDDNKVKLLEEIYSKLKSQAKILYIDYIIDNDNKKLQESIWINNALRNGMSETFVNDAISFGNNSLHFNTVDEVLNNFKRAGFIDPILCGSINMYRSYIFTRK